MDLLATIRYWFAALPLHKVMHTTWAWPLAETLHFLGLTMLIGTIGLFDLRLLGMARRIPPGALHRLIPWGISGFAVNAFTGFCFLSGTPEQYIYNNAFRLKLVFLTLAGLNVLVFYSSVFRKVRFLGADDDIPLAGRVIGGVSLCCWVGVISCGRLLTFFRPPF